jgi:hypothetical protein
MRLNDDKMKMRIGVPRAWLVPFFRSTICRPLARP